ncbi:hypothetical protein D3C71_631210 [compost metagenome]
MLEAHRAHDVAGRQGEQRAGDVGAGDLGGAAHLVDEAGEQVVLYILVAQRARAGVAHRRSRIPRHAAGDHRTRRTAAGNAAVHEGRADGQVDVRLVHAAGADALAFIAVVHVADVPVPVARTGFEAAFQAEAGTLGFQRVLGTARQLFGAVREQHVLAPLVEGAVLGQGSAGAVARLRSRDRVRVAGQVLGRLALAVQRVGDDAQVVGDREAAVGEHRGALQAAQQAHVGLGVGAVGRVRRVEVASAARVAARADGQRLATDGDGAPLGGRAQRVDVVGMARAARIAAELARIAEDLVFLGALGADAEPAAVEGLAEGGAVGALLAVAFTVLADIDAGFATVEVLAGDDVDHAGDGVRAVQRRGAIGQHFHAFDDRRRNRGQVGVTAGADAHAAAVDQHQAAFRAEVAQADIHAAEIARGAQRGRTAQARCAGCSDVLQDVGNVDVALLLDVGAVECHHRLRGLDTGLADARAGDLDAVEVGGGIAGFLCESGRGAAGGQRDDDRVAQRGGLQGHP